MANKKVKRGHPPTKHHHRLVITMIALLLLVGLGAAGWAGWNYWQEHRLNASQETVKTKFKNIHLESDNYQDEFLQAHVTYVVTDNDKINKDIRSVVDARFVPCKQLGQANTSNATYECHAAPDVNFATDEYVEVTYSFREYTGGDPGDTKVRQVGLLYDRKAGKRLGVSDLFKKDTKYLDKLSSMSRDALNDKFDKSYYNNGTFNKAMMQATDPKAGNFNDFLLLSDEKLTIIFEPSEAAPESEGVVRIELGTSELYDFFEQKVIDVFLPKLKEQKEAAKRLAEQAAQERERIQSEVASNRSNIDCSKMKCIALTYDDGPYAPNGDRLLDILKEKNAVASFFMVGNRVARYSDELKRAVDEHNEIGNHSWDHSDLTKLNDAAVKQQIDQTNQAIYNASGAYPKLMRPPYGATNTHTISLIGMPLAMWSVDTLDWKTRNADSTYQSAIAGAKPGAIILMHEIHSSTIDAAPRIIDELQSQGYVLVTVSELFGITKDNLADFTGKKLFQR